LGEDGEEKKERTVLGTKTLVRETYTKTERKGVKSARTTAGRWEKQRLSGKEEIIRPKYVERKN